MADFPAHNAAGVFALLGIFLGALLTGTYSLVTGWILRSRDLDLKIWEKIL
jgi:hypothetical protein